MNILIVEDELIEQQALTKILQRLYAPTILSLSYAVDGEQAVLLAKNLKPSIILLDIQLPLCDGLEVARRVRSFDEDVEIVMITAYSKFEYAQQSVKNKTYDYILKPYSIKTIKNLMDGLFVKIEEKQAKAKKLEENQRLQLLLQQEFLQKIYSSLALTEMQIKEYTDSLNLTSSCFALALFLPKAHSEGLFIRYIQQLETRFQVSHFKAEFQTVQLLLFYGESYIQLRQFLEQMETKRLEGLFVRGNVEYEWQTLPKVIIPLLGQIQNAVPNLNQNDAVLREMAEAFLAKDETSVLQKVEGLAFQFGLQKATELELRSEMLSFVIKLIQHIYSIGTVEASTIYHEVDYPIQQGEGGGIQQAWHEFHSFLKLLYTYVQGSTANKNEKALSLVKRRVNEQYAQPLSLEELASDVHLSPSYLSRLFKSVEGINLKDYILNVRIDKAKQSLFLGKSVEEVCFEIGFSDPAYFTKCFKRVTQKTPSQYVQDKKRI